jgi:hypothetical protein
MSNYWLVTLETLLIVVLPLLYLYLRGGLPLRSTVPCLLILPVLWYLTYAPLHELSHVVGAYVVGGKVTQIKLIPSFWLGEFGGAWITPVGLTQSWQQLIMTGSPYILDVLCVIAGMILLRRGLSRNPFVVGLVIMLLCLRPAFDLVCETIAFVLGVRGDLYYVEQIIGSWLTWSFLLFSIGLSVLSIVVVVRRFVGFQKIPPVDARV